VESRKLVSCGILSYVVSYVVDLVMRCAQFLLLQSLLLAGSVVPVGAMELRSERGEGPGTRLSVGAFVGGHVFAEGTNLGIEGGSENPDGAKNGILGGLRASVGLGPWLVAEAELAGLGTEDRLYRRRARVLGYRINALAPLSAGAFRPFVMVGAGVMQVAQSDAQGAAGLALDTKAEVHTGIGFDYRVTGNVSVRGDARVMQVPSKQGWGLASDVEAMVGAMVVLGRSPGFHPPPAPFDKKVDVPPARRVSSVGPNVQVPSSTSLPSSSLLSRESENTTTGGTDAVETASVTQSVGDLLERGRELRFEPGTSKLAQASLPLLDELAAALAREPSARLEIVVHTADSGDPKKDLTLSKQRALAIKRALDGKGASPEQLLATGRGSEDPLAPNLTRTGRLRNERVELHRVSATSSRP